MIRYMKTSMITNGLKFGMAQSTLAETIQAAFPLSIITLTWKVPLSTFGIPSFPIFLGIELLRPFSA
jgi:hypothetical protein